MAAVGWHAAAGRHRARARLRAEAPAHGRAIRSARRDDPRAHERRAAADLGADRYDHRVRDALDPGGGVPVAPRGRAEPTAGAHHERPRGGSAAPAQRRHPGDGAVLRAGDWCSRGAACARRSHDRIGAAGVSRRIGYYLPTVVVFVLVIGAWEAIVRLLDIREFLLPPPSAIATTLVDEWDTLATAGRNTLIEAVGGFGIGLAAGLIVALATARFALARGALMPFAIAANAVPIVAFAPIMNNWFGVTSPLSKMMIVAVLVFFPVMINVVRGLTSADAATLELMRSYAASDLDVLRK